MTISGTLKSRKTAPETAKDSANSALPSTVDFSSDAASCQLNQNSQSFVSLMHKQVLEHEKERQLLQQAEQEYNERKSALSNAQRNMQANARSKFLIAARQCHGVELEYIQLESQLEQCRAERDALQREYEALERDVREQQTERENEAISMGKQVAKQQAYQRRLEEAIQIHNQGVEKRHAKLDLLSSKAQALDDETDWKEQQLQACLRETKRLHGLEQDKNNIIQQLGSAVRSQLSKRQELRKALYKAQEDHRRVSEELMEEERQLNKK
ncbi:hypothetical protein MPSEU_000287200 [Mayamaea pseudoterrestris]|nr:hypothetical protein MPSEU_000287200 [Mayamaea pseudoterrestris]